MGWFTRSLTPPDDIVPNANNPASVPPSTVGPDQLVRPGDPHGVTVDPATFTGGPPATIMPSAWSGWPAGWWPPTWGGRFQSLTDTAWVCVDLNASILATMPPYLLNAAPTLDTGWLTNPDPDLYTSWEEFFKQLAWDFQLGEAFVMVTARYATGWPARFHVVPPWMVNAEIGSSGLREYRIGDLPVDGTPGGDLLHIRYSSAVGDAHGHGPLEAGSTALLAAQMLAQYSANVVSGIPPAVISYQGNLDAAQAADLKAAWMQARTGAPGEPAVLGAGITWEPATLSPKDMALVDLLQHNESRVAIMLGVPPFLVGLPTGGDSMTYSNVTSLFDFHWRAGLRPKADMLTGALSGFLLPRGTTLELNKDSYVQPDPLQRAQAYQIYANIRDETTGRPVMSVDEIRQAEHFSGGQPIAEVIR